MLPSVFEQVRAAVERAGPDTPPEDLNRFASSIAMRGTLAKAGRLAASPRSTGRALKTFELLNSRLVRLIAQVEALRPDERIALRSQAGGDDLSEMARTLARWCDATRAAHQSLSDITPVQAKGRPPSTAELDVAIYCGRILPSLRPSRRAAVWVNGYNEASGPFFALVEDVFRALGFQASAEHFAREASRVLSDSQK